MAYPPEFSAARRQFLQASLTALAAAGLPAWAIRDAHALGRERESDTPRRVGPNDVIRFGAIGVGGSKGGYQQGLNDTRAAASHPGCKVVAVCDVDSVHLDEGARVFGPDTAKYKHYQDLLARHDIDAVVIGTPDHWHATIATAAMRAGKDVYCEKPLTLTIDEGKRLVKTARETGRVFQVGSQQRSDAKFRTACELVRNGRLGKIKKVTTHLPTGPTGGPFEIKPVPADFDWNLWLGPAPQTDYVFERTHGNFRWWLDYSGGMLTDWGAHHNDIAQWGLGRDGSGPASVEALASGPRVGVNCYTTFPEFDVTFMYSDGVTLFCTNKGENGVEFEGEGGTIFVSRGVLRASDQRLLDDPLPANATRLYVSDDHMGNFIACMRSREEPICDVEIGHRSVSICHLANLSLRLGGRKLNWDARREEFVGDKEANSLLKRTPRKIA